MPLPWIGQRWHRCSRRRCQAAAPPPANVRCDAIQSTWNEPRSLTGPPPRPSVAGVADTSVELANLGSVAVRMVGRTGRALSFEAEYRSARIPPMTSRAADWMAEREKHGITGQCRSAGLILRGDHCDAACATRHRFKCVPGHGCEREGDTARGGGLLQLASSLKVG